MHLSFLTPEYPHPNSTPSGGLGTSIKNMAVELVKRNIKVSVFIYGQNKDLVLEENGISFHFIKQLHYDFFGWYRYRKYLEFYINKVILKQRIDALEAPDWTGITAFIKLKCPLIIRFNGSDSYFCRLEGRPQKKKNFWFEKLALQDADHLLSVSKFTADKTSEIFNLKKKVRVIPNSININSFTPSKTEPDPNSLLYFGSIIRKKGVLEIAETFNLVYKQNANVGLFMVGRDVVDIKTGRSTRELFQEILDPKASKNVIWLDSLPYEEVKNEIAKATVVVLPSFAEALPMTWLEAMAMEKALVTSDIGWAKEVMIDGETGYTVNPKDHTTYAKKIIELMENPQISKQMGKAARKRVLENFSTEVVIPKNIEFYRSIIEEPSLRKRHN